MSMLLKPIGPLSIASAILLSVVVQQVPSSASITNPYSGYGYDSSYPQCTATAAPSGFAIIGVGHGRPFTTNTCAAKEWSLANSTGSLYFNTGYALAYAKSETTNCAKASKYVNTGASGHQNSALQTAWAIGCSEADYAMASLLVTPTVWWADIETGNSWSTNTSLNQFTITGMFTELSKTGIPLGVYSSPSMWNQIVGTGYVNSNISANWQAGLTSCTTSSPGFTYYSSNTLAPLWLAQSGSDLAGNVTYDADSACS